METVTIKNIIRGKFLLIGVILFILIIMLVNVMIFKIKKDDQSLPLKFEKAEIHTLETTKLISGEIMPAKKQTIYLDSSKGEIKEIFVKEGQKVKKGQKLLAYKNDDLDLQLKQSQIDQQLESQKYNQVKKAIESLKQQLMTLEKTSSKNDQSLQNIKEQLEEQEYQQKTIELEIEKNNLVEKELRQKIEQLTVYSNLDGVVQNLDQRLINIPRSSTVEASNDVGSQETSTPIMTIVSKEPYEIQGTLSELQRELIQPKQAIKVTAKAISGKTWNGHIIEVSDNPITNVTTEQNTDSTDQQNISYYTFKAKLNSQEGLLPGYHVAIEVKLSSKETLAIPQNSVIEKGADSFVYIVNKNKIQKRRITTGISQGQWIEVLQGLKEGERVIKNPPSNIYSGMEVK